MKRFFRYYSGQRIAASRLRQAVTTHRIEDKDWQVVTVQSTQDGSILFIGNSMQEITPMPQCLN